MILTYDATYIARSRRDIGGADGLFQPHKVPAASLGASLALAAACHARSRLYLFSHSLRWARHRAEFTASLI